MLLQLEKSLKIVVISASNFLSMERVSYLSWLIKDEIGLPISLFRRKLQPFMWPNLQFAETFTYSKCLVQTAVVLPVVDLYDMKS